LDIKGALDAAAVDELGGAGALGGLAEVARAGVAVVAVDGDESALPGLAACLRAGIVRRVAVLVTRARLGLVAAVGRGVEGAPPGAGVAVVVGAGIAVVAGRGPRLAGAIVADQGQAGDSRVAVRAGIAGRAAVGDGIAIAAPAIRVAEVEGA
jgi:hypothetical protein